MTAEKEKENKILEWGKQHKRVESIMEARINEKKTKNEPKNKQETSNVITITCI